MRSYIASDWPSIQERQNLYKEVCRLEELLKSKIKELDVDEIKNNPEQ